MECIVVDGETYRITYREPIAIAVNLYPQKIASLPDNTPVETTTHVRELETGDNEAFILKAMLSTPIYWTYGVDGSWKLCHGQTSRICRPNRQPRRL